MIKNSFPVDSNRNIADRCAQCANRVRDELTGSFDCPHHLVPVMGMDCFRKLGNVLATTEAVKKYAFRVRVRRCKPRYVVEFCPHCERENSLVWDVERDGYLAHCVYCGGRLMLCSECYEKHDGKCDYDSYIDDCRRMRSQAFMVGLKKGCDGVAPAWAFKLHADSAEFRLGSRHPYNEMTYYIHVFVYASTEKDAISKAMKIYHERSEQKGNVL